MFRALCGALFILALSACMSMPPRADEWTFWRKTGVTEKKAVEKAMLECGNPMWAREPFKAGVINHHAISQDILFERCMEKDGFRYTSELGTGCSIEPGIPECKLPIEQIPSRDINRRLNGVYCTKFPLNDLCKP